jgi:hypothetical protein
VDSIYITENNKEVPTAMREALKSYVNDGFVHLDAWGSDVPSLLKIYARCLQTTRDEYDWVAFFDPDEYLIFLERWVSRQAITLKSKICLHSFLCVSATLETRTTFELSFPARSACLDLIAAKSMRMK